jgi:hypothetical protein
MGAAQLHDRELIDPLRRLSSLASVEGLRLAFDASYREARLGVLAAESARALAPFRLPDRLRAALRDSRDGVGVLPWRLGYCEVNGLRCKPPRTLQLYSAYSPELDRWNEAGLRREPPTYLLVHRPEAQRRLFFSTAPRLWTAVEELYDVIESDQQAGVLVMRLREDAGLEPESQSRVLSSRAGIYELPSGSGRGRIEVGLRPRAGVGLLSTLAWVPPLEIELSDGVDWRRYRITPALAPFGLRVSMDDSLEGLERWFAARDIPRPERFRFAGPGLAFYSIGTIRFSSGDRVTPSAP